MHSQACDCVNELRSLIFTYLKGYAVQSDWAICVLKYFKLSRSFEEL